MAVSAITVALNDIVKVRAFCNCAEQLSVNVLYFKIATVTTPGPVPLKALADELSNNWAVEYRNVLSQDAQYRGCGVQGVFPMPVPTLELFSQNGAGAGTDTSTALPKQTCGIISKITGFAGHGFRGRMYVPFPGEAQNLTNGKPAVGYDAVLIALGVKTLGTVTVNVTGPGIMTLTPMLRRDLNPNDANPGPYTYEPIIDFVTRNRWGTQRRRSDYSDVGAFPV